MDNKINNIDSYNKETLLLKASEARDSAVNAKINGHDHDIVLGKVPQLSPESIQVLKQLKIPLPPSLDNLQQKKNDLNTRITNLEKAIGNETAAFWCILLGVAASVLLIATILLGVFLATLGASDSAMFLTISVGGFLISFTTAMARSVGDSVSPSSQSKDEAVKDLKTSFKNYIQSVDEGGELSKILQDNLDYFNEHGEEIIQRLEKAKYHQTIQVNRKVFRRELDGSIYIQEVRKVANYYKKFAPSINPPSYQETLSNVLPNYAELGLGLLEPRAS